MIEQEPRWTRRHKRCTRRWANDARICAPLIAIALCVAGSATAILAVEHVPATPKPVNRNGTAPPVVECALVEAPSR